MTGEHACASRRTGRIWAWSGLVGITFALAAFLYAFTAGAVAETGPAAPSVACRAANPSIAALADLEDERTQALMRMAAGGAAPYPEREFLCASRSDQESQK